MAKYTSLAFVMTDAINRRRETLEVKVPFYHGGIAGENSETVNWLVQHYGDDRYAVEMQYPHLIYIFSNPDLAFEFKMRWG